MQEFILKKGLDLPINGAPVQKIYKASGVKSIAVLGADYIGLKPRISVAEGDKVKRGQELFFHKDSEDIKIVAPVSGTVSAINRGARRVLQSIVIDIDKKDDSFIDFSKVGGEKKATDIIKKLCAAGFWTSFRTRPYSKVPHPEDKAHAIFITAMDTEPLSAQADLIINEASKAFEKGLEVISKLTEGKTYLCKEVGVELPVVQGDNIEVASFSGPHPAGLAGTHIHFLEHVDTERSVWTIGYQDVIAIGQLMLTGQVDATRIIALSGPLCEKPRLLKTVMGANLEQLTQKEYDDSVPARIISGSVLSGREATGPIAYLGRYARQVTVIEENRKQTPLGWILPMPSRFAFQPVLGSAFSKKLYNLTSNMNGGRRAMVPLGTFEELMPQDYLPTQLLRALLVMDTDVAQELGALELDEEDLCLAGFSCPAKYEYGIALRDCLNKIEKDG